MRPRRVVFFWAVCLALAPLGASAEERREEILAPGLRHIVLRRGGVATTPRFRVRAGSSELQSQADDLLSRLEASTPPLGRITCQYRGGRYDVSVDELETRRAAQKEVERLRALAFRELAIEEYVQDATHRDGPWEIHLLEATPDAVEVRVAHAYDAAIGLETTAALARRRDALAAVNGGYYLRTGILRGDSQGALMMGGTLVSEPDRSRAAVGFLTDGGNVRAVFGRLGFRGHVALASGETIPLSGLNRERGAGEIVAYTPVFHRTSLTSADGAEVIVEDGRVTAVRERGGSSPIPGSGFVVSLAPTRVADALKRFKVGDAVRLELSLTPLLEDPENAWDRVSSVLGGGPLLLHQGRRVDEPHAESVSRVFFLARHPRTAVGARADGTLLFVTVDGRRSQASVGMSLGELTDFLLELGAVSAMNLDGGGSTTMVVRGRAVNVPSDLTGERENGDAILIFKKAAGASESQRPPTP